MSVYKEIFLACSKLGCISFGGPLAAVGIIQKELVIKRRWADPEWYAGALAITNMLPGPTATSLVIYLGYLRAGIAGGAIAGVCYIYPAFFMMLALSAAYFHWGLLPAVAGVVYGLTPAAIGVLLWAAWQLARASVKNFPALLLFGAAFIVTFYLSWPVAAVILLGGVAGAAATRPATPRLLAVAPLPLLFLTTFKAGALMFGGGYVIVPFLAQDFVERLRWISAEEFLVGFALGKATPGPLSITATFVGYKVAGLAGACVATLGVFLPVFLIILSLAPYLERLRALPAAQGFLAGIKAAAVGAILAASAELITQAMPDWTSVGLIGAAFAASFFLEPTWIFLGAAAAGLGLSLR